MIATEHADQEDRIDIVVLSDDFHAACEHFGVGVRGTGHVHRVGQRGLRQQDGGQALACGLGQLGHLQPGVGQAVGGDGRLAATVGDDRHPTPTRLLHQRQALGHRQDLIGVAHHTYSNLLEQVHRHFIAAGERTGVRTRGLLAQFGRARFVHHHRLQGRDFARSLQKALAVTKTFDVERGDAGVFFLAQVAQIVVEADIGLVTRPDIGGEADMAVVLGFEHKRQQHVARLRDEADVAGLDVAQVEQVHVLVQVEHARGVGTDDAHATCARGRHHLALELCAFGPGLSKAAGEDDRALHTLASAVGHQGGEGGCRRAHQGQIHRPRNVVERCIGGHTEDLGHLGVDRIDLAAVVALDEADHGLVTALGGVGRSTDDGDRIRRQKVVQAAARGGGGAASGHVIPP